jgi:iron-sulfur cluster repair protein YtfE (RIC family)
MQTEPAAGDILEADHRELDGLLAELRDELSRDAPEPRTTYHRLDLFWARLAVHIRAEHVVLFPALLAAATEADRESLDATLADLRHDHDFFMKELARAVKALRLVPDFGNEPDTFTNIRKLVDTVATRLALHNALEEKTVYPLADLSPSDRTRIQKELANLPSRFSSGPLA